MDLKSSTLLSLVSFGVATGVGLTQLIKWFQEFKERRAAQRAQGTKADVERDSIAIKSAEGALLMMQGLLEVAHNRIDELEKDNDALRKQIRRAGE